MDDFLIKDWNSKVKPNDIVFHLGDVSWYNINKTKDIIFKLSGQKILIKGNHDKSQIKEFFNTGHDYLNLRIDDHILILFHFPILEWDRRHHSSFHLHGHVHGRSLGDNMGRMFDVGVDNNPNLTLFSFKEIKHRLLKIPSPKSRLGAD
jgi:calcineurin-like phosphoesterase family protein